MAHPAHQEFMDLYPEVEVSLILVYDDLDLAMREADVAIRLTPPRQPTCSAPFDEPASQCYASPDYLKDHGMPQTPEELDNHKIVTFGDQVGDQTELLPSLNFLINAGRGTKARQPVLKVNNVYGIYRAVLSGVGIGALPNYFLEGSSSLVRILPELHSPETEIYFVYPEELRQSARIAVFRDFLVRKILESRK